MRSQRIVYNQNGEKIGQKYYLGKMGKNKKCSKLTETPTTPFGVGVKQKLEFFILLNNEEKPHRKTNS